MSDEKLYTQKDMDKAIFQEQYAFGTFLADIGVPIERRPKYVNQVMAQVAEMVLRPAKKPDEPKT
jgi:hypothetical protein